jgi:hypothetical protein
MPVRLTPYGRAEYTDDSLEQLIRDAALNERLILRNHSQISLVVISQETSTVVIEGGE